MAPSDDAKAANGSAPADAEAEEVEARPPYLSYMHSIYAAGIIAQQLPIVTTDPTLLAEAARKAMTPTAFNYVAGGAGEGSTMDANRLAFRQWKLMGRFLQPQMPSDMGVTLFGKKYECPIFMAPVGVQGIVHPDKETGMAEVCAELGVPFILSTAATSSIEEVAAASGEGSPRWFQLYWPADDVITASLLSRAKASGFSALVVTLDAFTMGWRPLDLDQAYIPFMIGVGTEVGTSDPAFRKKFADTYGEESLEGVGTQGHENHITASREWVKEAFPGVSHSWDDLKLLRKHWGPGNPILLKGIMTVEDAIRAADTGLVDGIIVSNHGGRQIDGAVGALEMLPEIVDAVKGKGVTVMFDSGIRTGADCAKALALGAEAVLVGRPPIYGLGCAGKEGAKHVLACMLAELDSTLCQTGIKSVNELNRGMLRRTNYGGDVKSVL